MNKSFKFSLAAFTAFLIILVAPLLNPIYPISQPNQIKVDCSSPSGVVKLREIKRAYPYKNGIQIDFNKGGSLFVFNYPCILISRDKPVINFIL